MIEEWVQKRYDEKTNIQLKRLYSLFLAKCKRHRIALVKNLLPENKGLHRFIAVAKSSGYKLGMNASPNAGVEVCAATDIVFEYRKQLTHPKFRGDEVSCFRADRIQNDNSLSKYRDTPGFGLSLDVYGWYYFIDRKSVGLKKLYQRIADGETIEAIFGSPYRIGVGKGKVMLLEYRGELLTTEEACRKASVPIRKFYRRLGKIAKSGVKVDLRKRQEVFDCLVEEVKHIHKKSIPVSDKDYEVVNREASNQNLTIDEWLHQKISAWYYS